jgi:tetratricopeptide (TPR) repeat protein
VVLVIVFACGFAAGYYSCGDRWPGQDTTSPPIGRIEEKDGRIAAFEKEVISLKKLLAKKEEEIEKSRKGTEKRVAQACREPGDTNEKQVKLQNPELARLAQEAAADPLNRELAEKYLAKALHEGTQACEDAVKIYREAVKENPESADAHYNLGIAYLQQMNSMQEPTGMQSAMELGRLAAGAIEELGKTLEIKPKDFDALLARGTTYYYFPGRMKDAVADLEKLVDITKDKPPEEKHAMSYFWLARAYRKSGNGKKSLETLRKGCELFPQNEMLRNELLRMERK